MKTAAAFCCLLSVAAWTADADINVEGTEGGEVTFVCQHKLASKNDKAFCKDPCQSNADILATVQSGAMVREGRITLEDQATGAFTVSIHRLQLSDAGTYWCTVDRKLFTTYTAVHLTIKKAATTVTADVSTTWTHAETFSPTQSIPEMDTSGPAHVSTTSNGTNTGDDSSSTGTLLYACIGAASALTVLLCAASFRKCRKVSEPQPQVSSSSADQRAPTKTPPNKTCAQEPSLDPPTSAGTAADRLPSPIYENCSIFRENTDSRQSAANAQRDHDIASRIYIRPLPPIVCEHESSTRRHREKTTPEASIPESKPKTLWFGLDLSGTI